MKVHFIAGLPRCGKTMLAAILRQNPRFFHFGMESPVADILMATERQTSRVVALTMSLDLEVKRRLRLGVFEAVYGHRDRVCWDTNRFWSAKLPLLVELFPDCKIVACVRNVAWIMDSFERLYRRSPLELSGLYGFDPNTTVFSRCAKLASSDGVVGRALDALREAYYGEHARTHLLLVDYVNLCADPRGTLERIYEFVEEPIFLHKFDSLESDNDGFDLAIGSPNLHKVRPQVECVSRATVLPPMLFERFAHDDFWNAVEPLTENEVSHG